MTQGDAHTTEEVVGCDAVGIPFRDGIGGLAKLIGLAIGKGEGLIIILHLQFTLRFHPIDRLIVQHPSIVLKEGPIATGDIDQHRGEAIAARSPLTPQGGLRAARVAVATATRVTGIDRPQASAIAQTAGAHIIVESIPTGETTGIAATHPRSLRVVGNGGVEENRRGARRKGIAGRDGHIRHLQPLLFRAGDCPQEYQS